jgi:hypothetical protein
MSSGTKGVLSDVKMVEQVKELPFPDTEYLTRQKSEK